MWKSEGFFQACPQARVDNYLFWIPDSEYSILRSYKMDAQTLARLKKLTPLEVRMRLQSMPGWYIENNRLKREYQFENFVRAMVFVNKIVNPIEENQNYPRITIAYNRVTLSLFTNEVGAVTVMDFEMAAEFDRLAGVQGKQAPGMIKA